MVYGAGVQPQGRLAPCELRTSVVHVLREAGKARSVPGQLVPMVQARGRVSGVIPLERDQQVREAVSQGCNGPAPAMPETVAASSLPAEATVEVTGGAGAPGKGPGAVSSDVGATASEAEAMVCVSNALATNC